MKASFVYQKEVVQRSRDAEIAAQLSELANGKKTA